MRAVINKSGRHSIWDHTCSSAPSTLSSNGGGVIVLPSKMMVMWPLMSRIVGDSSKWKPKDFCGASGECV